MIQLPNKSTKLQLERILVLEDDRDFSAILKDFLESIPFDVTTVENGVEGLREVMAHPFDVIICDMMMPKLSGDMFYLAVERVKPELCRRFVFVTGHRANPKIDGFIRQIRGTILQKPFHMDELRETIAYAMARR